MTGSRFLRRPNAEGWNVRGWNRSSAATFPLKKYGFAIDDTLGDLVSGSDVLLSSLANDDAVRATYLGKDGAFAHVQSGTTILEMSTISPDLSAPLHQEARKRGAEMMDLPVSGSTPAVDSGTVTLFAGGELETFNRCIPIFESIARQWYLMGPATARAKPADRMVATDFLIQWQFFQNTGRICLSTPFRVSDVCMPERFVKGTASDNGRNPEGHGKIAGRFPSESALLSGIHFARRRDATSRNSQSRGPGWLMPDQHIGARAAGDRQQKNQALTFRISPHGSALR